MSTETFVYTMNQTGAIGAWSRYVFPYNVEAKTIYGPDLFLRAGSVVYRVDETVNYDEVYDEQTEETTITYFDSVVHWPWLDFGAPGVTKMMEGFDIVGEGVPTVQIGYAQENLAYFTDEYEVGADTMTGGIIAMPVSAPTLSVKITYKGGDAGNSWRLDSFNLYLNDRRH